MTFANTLLDKIGDSLAHILARESSGYDPITPSDSETLERVLRPGDVLLVEGNQKISSGIKYLTRSTWSHAALYIGDAIDERDEQGRRKNLIEVNLGEGCVAAAIDKYECYNTRICRPVGLTRKDRKKVVEFMVNSIGLKYDMRNIIDLMRFLIPTPPVPARWRRHMISIGSGEPTRAICSTLIAQAFQSVQYPILPRIERVREQEKAHDLSTYARREILHIRHHSLYAPRDFDISPYFKIIKPTVAHGFDYKQLEWGTVSFEPDPVEEKEAIKELEKDKIKVDNRADVSSTDRQKTIEDNERDQQGDRTKKNERTLALDNSLYAFSRASLDKAAGLGHRASGKISLHAGLLGDFAHHVRLVVQRFWAR